MTTSGKVVMVHEKQISRSESADKETRARALNRARRPFAPSSSFISGVALPKDASAGANEHPQAAISQFRDHALQRPLRCFHRAVKFPCLALIGRDAHTLQLLRASKPIANRLYGMRHWHDPFTGGKHRRLVHPESIRTLVADAKLSAEYGLRSIRVVADTRPDIVLRRVLVAAIEDIPEPPLRIDPKRGVENAGTFTRRHSDRFGRREGLASILAVGKHHRVLWCRLLGPAGEPRGKHAPLRGTFDAGNALPCALGEVNCHTALGGLYQCIGDDKEQR